MSNLDAGFGGFFLGLFMFLFVVFFFENCVETFPTPTQCNDGCMTAQTTCKDLQKRAGITEDKCIPNYLECLDECYDLYRKAAEEELKKGKQ